MYVVTALIIVGTTAQVYGQLEAGKDQEAALKTQAEQERFAAESRELERQQKLNKALAANAVGMGMSGIKAEGTPASIALKLSDRLAQAQLRRQASNARSASQLAAAGTLLSGATKAYQTSGGGGGDWGGDYSGISGDPFA
jgi:hypothetical protein